MKRVLLDENVPHDLRRWLAMPGVEAVRRAIESVQPGRICIISQD